MPAENVMRLTYLDSDAIIAATAEPAARQYLLGLKATSYIAVCPRVIHEMAAASLKKRRRRVQTLLAVAHGYSEFQCPEILRAILLDKPLPTPRSLMPISRLAEVLAVPHPPEVAQFFRDGGLGRGLDEPLQQLMRQAHAGYSRRKTFREYFEDRAADQLASLVQVSLDRGNIDAAVLTAEPIGRLLQRKQVFNLIAMTLATMWRSFQTKGHGRDGCLSDLPTMIEVAHADVFLTRDRELVACNRLVRETFPQFPLEVRILPPDSLGTGTPGAAGLASPIKR